MCLFKLGMVFFRNKSQTNLISFFSILVWWICGCGLLCFSKVSDMVTLDVLVEKLVRCGSDSVTVKWLKAW